MTIKLLPIKFKQRHTQLVIQLAIGSRLLLISLIVLWRSLLRPYDTSASINPSCLMPSKDFNNTDSQALPQRIYFPHLASAIERSIVWDSVYFVRIAECGYEYEQSYAFLPLLPISISLLSETVFAPLIPLIGYRAVLGFSAYVVNSIAFILAALYLYRLSVILLKDPEESLRATILFCLNPASIFYSSIYSESLFALLSIGGLYYFIGGATNVATLWFALSGCARSNGVLNAGYILFQTMHRAFDAIFLKKSAYIGLRILFAGAFRCLCIVMPFISFQAYGYYNMCVVHSRDEMRPWCKARLPFLYNFIQSHYWGVGFLRYFQVKQLPNFLLASPILTLSLCSIIHYVKQWPEVFFSLGFQASPVDRKLVGIRTDTATVLQNVSSNKSEDQNLRRRKKEVEGDNFVSKSVNGAEDRLSDTPVLLLPIVLHLVFMAATAFFVMHVQVATRFLSASPLIYWFASYLMVSPGISKRWGYFIWVYCAAYILLGSLLFSNFYPFT